MNCVRGAKTHHSGTISQSDSIEFLASRRIAAHLHLAEGYISRAFCIMPGEFYLPTRGPRNVSEARQLVMYIARVEFGLPTREIARRYQRDSSTVSHACRKTEDRRDDPSFDEIVTEIEGLVTLKWDPALLNAGRAMQ